MSIADCGLLPPFHCEVGAVDLPWVGLLCIQEPFWVCYWVVLAILGPRTTLSCLVDLSCVHLLFGVVTLLSSLSSQSYELVVLLRYAVVGLQTIESRIKG